MKDKKFTWDDFLEAGKFESQNIQEDFWSHQSSEFPDSISLKVIQRIHCLFLDLSLVLQLDEPLLVARTADTLKRKFDLLVDGQVRAAKEVFDKKNTEDQLQVQD